MQRAGEKGKSIPSRWNRPEGSRNLAPGRNGGREVCRGRTYVAGPVDGGGSLRGCGEAAGRGPSRVLMILGNLDRSNQEQCNVISASK